MTIDKKKPPGLTYGVDESPPLGMTIALGFQHIFAMAGAFVFPVIIVRALGGPHELAQSMIRISMIAAGIGTLLQTFRSNPIGCGYLCPQHPGPSYVSASLLAANTGEPSLIYGMTLLAGSFEIAISRLIHKLRAIFPTEVTGVVVTMVGVSLIPVSFSHLLGVGGADRISTFQEAAAGLGTLAMMVGLNVWGKKGLRLFCVLLATASGYIACYCLEILASTDLSRIWSEPVFALPNFRHVGWSLDVAFILPFFIAALSSTLKAVGDMTTCQKINDADWKRPDLKSIGGGLFAGGLSTVLGGLMGAMGQSTATGSVGLSIATGATSRRIGYAVGAFLILMAFLPKLSAVLAVMPLPVMGALMIFVSSFMIVAGIQIMTSRMLDARKTFVIGFSLVFGLSAELFPSLYADVHPMISPLFSSSLSLGTLSAITLNIVFRLGISRTWRTEWDPKGRFTEEIFSAMQSRGEEWGMRQEIAHRAVSAMNELMETASFSGLIEGKVQAEMSFDEFNLDIDLSYKGRPMDFPEGPPSHSELMADERNFLKLSGFLVKKYADHVSTRIKDGECSVRLHFDH